MLTRFANFLPVLAAPVLLVLASQCAAPSKPHSAVAHAESAAAPHSESGDKQKSDVHISCAAAPANQKGMQFTILSHVDKNIEISFHDGKDSLKLKKGVAGTATFVYDPATKKTTLKLGNGTDDVGPKEVPTRGAYNAIRRLGSLTEQPANQTDDKRPRKLVTGRNHGLEFSFMVSGAD